MQDIEPTFKTSNLSLQPTLYLLRLKDTVSQNTSSLHIMINNKYRELTTELDIFSTNGRVSCKILSYAQSAKEQFVEIDLPNSDSDFKIPFNKSDFFLIACRILNKSQESSNNMILLKTLKHSGYDKFLEYRKKVKRLQNLTSPLNWQISHRIVIKHHLNTASMEIQQQHSVCLNLLLDPRLTIQLEQLSYLTPQNKLGQTIGESIISLRQLSLQKGQQISIKFSQYLQLKFIISKLSTNIGQGLISIRILQGPTDITSIEVSDNTIKPYKIDKSSYFDPQYYFLSKNMSDIKEDSKAYDQLNQLTKTFPTYPHIKNQVITSKSTFITFLVKYSKKQEIVKIPIFNLIKGLNSVSLQSGSLRYYLQYRQKQAKTCLKKLRTFLISPKSIWNTQYLKKYKQFSIKLITSKTIVRLDYAVTIKQATKDTQFKKYLDKLKIRQEMQVQINNNTYIIGYHNDTSIYIIEKKSQFQQIILSQHLYNQEATVQIEAQNNIISFGSFRLQDITQQTIVSLQPYNIFILFSCRQLPLPSSSANRIYKLAYSLKAHNQYDLQINTYKCRISNQQLKPIDYCVFSKNPQAQLNISIRRRQYDEILEQHTTKEYINQTVYINNNSKITKGLSYHIPDQAYEIVQLEFLQNDGICKFTLQITNYKEQLLDQQSEYAIKIPSKIWSKMSPVNSIVFEVIGSKKSSKRQKQLTYLNSSEILLKMLDYRDSLSVKIDNHYGYSKFYDLIKVNVGIQKGQIDFDGDSTMMVVMTVDGRQLWFLLRYNEDAEQSDGSRRTVSKEKTVKDDRQIVDELNKTTRMDDILKIKTKINEITDENRKLITKAVRLENNSTILQQRLEEIKKIANRKKQQLKFTKTVSKPTNQPKIYREICSCGYKRPQFMGYCTNCLQDLQKRYRIVYKKFEEKAKQYESTFYKNAIRKDKFSMLQKKLKNLKNRLLMRQSEDNHKNEEELQQESLNEIKERIIGVKNEIATYSIKSKNMMEATNSLQLNLETKINEENRQVFSLIQQIDGCKVKIREIQNKMKSMTE